MQIYWFFSDCENIFCNNCCILMKFVVLYVSNWIMSRSNHVFYNFCMGVRILISLNNYLYILLMPLSFGLSLLFTNFAENVNQLMMKLWPKHLAGNSYFIAISSFPLRSASIVASLAVRYFFDRSSIDLRSAIEERTKGERRMNDGRSKNHRRSIEERTRNYRRPIEKQSRKPWPATSLCSGSFRDSFGMLLL